MARELTPPTPIGPWRSSEVSGTPLPEDVVRQDRENAQRAEAERQQRIQVASAVTVSAEPIEIVHPVTRASTCRSAASTASAAAVSRSTPTR